MLLSLAPSLLYLSSSYSISYVKGHLIKVILIENKLRWKQKKKRCFEDRVNLVFFSTYDWQGTRTKKVVTCKKRILRNMSMYTYAGLASFATENSDLKRKRDSGRQSWVATSDISDSFFFLHQFFLHTIIKVKMTFHLYNREQQGVEKS